MRNIKLPTVAILLAVALSAGCSRNTSSFNSSQQRSAPSAAEEDHAALATIPRIGAAEADSLVKQSQAVIIDVRAEAAYRWQHIKGAISLPETQFIPRLASLPRDEKIITYCT